MCIRDRLKSWKNAPDGKIVKTDVSIAKNYLEKEDFDADISDIRVFVSILNGSITVKQLPSPSLLSTVMVPPIFSTSCFTIGIPRPVPL